MALLLLEAPADETTQVQLRVSPLKPNPRFFGPRHLDLVCDLFCSGRKRFKQERKQGNSSREEPALRRKGRSVKNKTSKRICYPACGRGACSWAPSCESFSLRTFILKRQSKNRAFYGRYLEHVTGCLPEGGNNRYFVTNSSCFYCNPGVLTLEILCSGTRHLDSTTSRPVRYHNQ